MIPKPDGVAIDLVVESARWRRTLPGAPRLAREAARAALLGAGAELGAAELAIVLADDARVRLLNRRWRGKDAATNVLAFASGEAAEPPAPTMLGDVVLAYGTVAREAREQKKPLADHMRHLVVHGVLHLLGYDHVRQAPARRMERLETKILGSLGIGDPYAIREDAHG